MFHTPHGPRSQFQSTALLTTDAVDTVDTVDIVYTVDMTHNDESFHTLLSCSNVSMGMTG